MFEENDSPRRFRDFGGNSSVKISMRRGAD